MPNHNQNNEEILTGTVTQITKYPNPNYPWIVMVKLAPNQTMGSYVRAVNNLYFDLEEGTEVEVSHNWNTFIIKTAKDVKQNTTVGRAVPPVKRKNI